MAWDDGDSAFYSDDNDPTKVLAGIISPAPAHSLVMPPPSTPPRTGPGVTTPQTGSLAYAPTQAVAKNRDSLANSFRTGVSNPPNGGYGATISSAAQPVRQAQPVQPVVQAGMPQPVNPDPQGSLRPGGTTTPMPVMPQGAQQVQGPSQLDLDQSRLAALTNKPAGGSQIQNPIGRGIVRGLDIAGSILAPNVTQFLPGSTLNKARQVAQQQGIVGNDQAQAQAAAGLADTQSQTQQREAQAAMQGGANQTKLDVQNLKNTGTADVADTRANAMDDSTAMRSGMKPTTDPTTGKKSYVADPDSPVYQAKQAGEELAQAKAELARAGNDPSSPAYQLAFKKAQTAQQNANAATTRATAYMGNYLQGAYNTGLHGDVLPGAPGIGNDQGSRTVVGTRNAGTAIKNQANVAQFNDVHGALDSLENSAKALVQGGGKLNDPKIAAALAQPKGTFGKWVQGQVANGSMTPEQRDYVIANRAAHENIQAMRKAAGGTATDSSVEKLDALIPGAQTPDLDYFLRQTGQIRQTAQRLGQGVTTAAGGSNLRNGPVQSQQNGIQTPTHVITMKDGSKVNARVSPDGKSWINATTGKPLQ